MDENSVKAYPNVVTPSNPILFNPDVCTGCNRCVDVCVMDIMMRSPETGKPPVILYPDECYYDGLCVVNCPEWHEGAIRINHPLNQRVRWKRKATGEHFRLGMANPPPPNDKPPVGGWNARSKG